MIGNYKTYYFKNGRLDLSSLEGRHEEESRQEEDYKKEDHQEERKFAANKIYVDDTIFNILEEMGNCFLEEEKLQKNA